MHNFFGAAVLGIVFFANIANAQIFNVTQSSTDTGGNTGGGTVIQGDASSRVEVRNSGGTNTTKVRIEIEKEENGEVHRETLYERLESRKNIELRLSTTTSGGSANVRVRIGDVSTTTGGGLSNLFRVFKDAMPDNVDTPTTSARAALQAQIAIDTEPGFFARLVATFRTFWGF